MTTLEFYFLLFLGIQFFHSIEELTHNFHKKFPPLKMSFKFFLGFEIIFFGFWLLVYLLDTITLRAILMNFFILLMLVNGFWHIVWWSVVKKYVPGLATAPVFVILFLYYYFQVLA